MKLKKKKERRQEYSSTVKTKPVYFQGGRHRKPRRREKEREREGAEARPPEQLPQRLGVRMHKMFIERRVMSGRRASDNEPLPVRLAFGRPRERRRRRERKQLRGSGAPARFLPLLPLIFSLLDRYRFFHENWYAGAFRCTDYESGTFWNFKNEECGCLLE